MKFIKDFFSFFPSFYLLNHHLDCGQDSILKHRSHQVPSTLKNFPKDSPVKNERFVSFPSVHEVQALYSDRIDNCPSFNRP